VGQFSPKTISVQQRMLVSKPAKHYDQDNVDALVAESVFCGARSVQIMNTS